MNLPVTECWDCPFAVKDYWSNEDGDSGVDINDCTLGFPPSVPSFEARKQLGAETPPSWCKLREKPVLVTLRTK